MLEDGDECNDNLLFCVFFFFSFFSPSVSVFFMVVIACDCIDRGSFSSFSFFFCFIWIIPISILTSCSSSCRFFILSSCRSIFFAVLSPIVGESAANCIVEFIFSVAIVSSSSSLLYFCISVLFCLIAFAISANVAHSSLKFSILDLF